MGKCLKNKPIYTFALCSSPLGVTFTCKVFYQGLKHVNCGIYLIQSISGMGIQDTSQV